MARFYEQYGYTILWTLTSMLGVGLTYWLLVVLATHDGVLPSWIETFVLRTHGIVVGLIVDLIAYIEKRIQWFGAVATLATFAFGLVTGVRQAKRQLPRRLMQFMTEQLSPVYDNSEAIVAAVAYRNASVAHRTQLFRRDPPNQALNTLGNAFRPRRRRSLDEAIKEADTYIDLTEKRLKSLQDVRAHAHILRGAVRSAEGLPTNAQDAVASDQKIEADFASAISNESARAAALELRGLFRGRLGNLAGASQDFSALLSHSQQTFCVRGQARALRHLATVTRMQAARSNLTLLRRARRNLNSADRLLITH
jgi:hypothetical protein